MTPNVTEAISAIDLVVDEYASLFCALGMQTHTANSPGSHNLTTEPGKKLKV